MKKRYRNFMMDKLGRIKYVVIENNQIIKMVKVSKGSISVSLQNKLKKNRNKWFNIERADKK